VPGGQIGDAGLERPDQASDAIDWAPGKLARPPQELAQRQPDNVGAPTLHPAGGSLQGTVEIVGQPDGELA
jgi:hypothetical protein